MTEGPPAWSQGVTHRTRDVLARWQAVLSAVGDATSASATAALLDELGVYLAELELQNQELVEANARAERARGHYAGLFDALPLPALVLGRHGMVTDANAQAAALFGFRGPAFLQRHSIRRLIQRPPYPGWFDDMLEARLERGVQIYPAVDVQATGSAVVTMDVHVLGLTRGDDEDPHRLMVFVDRRGEREHERERRLFRSLLDNSDTMIYAHDRDGRCLLANASLLALIGKPAGEVIGHRRDTWLGASDAAEHGRHDARVLSTSQSLVYEEEIHGDGQPTRYFISHKFPLLDGDGHVFAVGGITTEVSELRRMELRLQLAMQVFSKGTEGILICDDEARVVAVNRAFETITGYTETEMLGQNPRILASGKHGPEFFKVLWETVAVEGSWEGEIWNRRRNGEVYPQRTHISRVIGVGGETTNYISVFSDVTHKKMAEEEIERLAFYDVVTGAPNRYLLHDRVQQAIRVSSRRQESFALLFLDMDRFKDVNDGFGHDVGDALLVEFAKRLRTHVRDADTLSRLGGDEFVLVLTGVDRPVVQSRAQQLLDSVMEPYQVGSHHLTMSCSIGIAMYPDDGATYEQLLKHADTALYQAKGAGRNAYRFFNRRMADAALLRVTMEGQLRAALESGGLWLAYQPLVCFETGRVCGVEALARWRQADGVVVAPDTFIPIAEESGLIMRLGTWALRESFEQMRRWERDGIGGFTVSVNISARQFLHTDLPEVVKALLEEYACDPARLELELTEQVALKDPERGIDIMQRLRASGVRVSIDDFGTGYASLAYLNRLPVDGLKIDKSFVQQIGADPNSDLICRSIIQLARTKGIRTTAEGVETAAQEAYLRENACHVGQGYFYSPPMAGSDLPGWLRTRAWQA